MNEAAADDAGDVSAKIARLVEERGWNQDEFARLAKVHRLTIRNIFQGGQRRLHNATVSACARALGFTVHELRSLPLPVLVGRLQRASNTISDQLRRQYEMATQPEVAAWLERHPEEAARLAPDELEELLSLQGTGGPLTSFGVARFVEQLQRRRRLLDKVRDIAGTEWIDLLEPLLDLIHEKIQPYRQRGLNEQPLLDEQDKPGAKS